MNAYKITTIILGLAVVLMTIWICQDIVNLGKRDAHIEYLEEQVALNNSYKNEVENTILDVVMESDWYDTNGSKYQDTPEDNVKMLVEWAGYTTLNNFCHGMVAVIGLETAAQLVQAAEKHMP